MPINNEFKEKVNLLRESPLYSMSLGAKELFHTNYWSFLLKQKEYADFVRLFFSNIDIDESPRVEREKERCDLIVYDKEGNRFVIQNKIKSYVNIEEINEYSKKCRLGVLTGIKKPPFDLPKKWKFVEYKEISKLLRNIADKDPNMLVSNVTKEYCDIIDTIQFLMDYALKENENTLSFENEEVELLKDIGLLDVYKKLKADDYIQNGFKGLEEKFSKLKSSNNIKFFMGRSFHTNKAVLSFAFEKFPNGITSYSNEDDIQMSIGVQIEDNQFRLFASKKGVRVEDLFETLKRKEWFEDYSFEKNKRIRNHLSDMKNDFYSFGGDWIYQYFDLEAKEENLKSYKTISELIEKELEKAWRLINE